MKGDNKEREALDMESSSVQKGPEQWFLAAHPERGTLAIGYTIPAIRAC